MTNGSRNPKQMSVDFLLRGGSVKVSPRLVYLTTAPPSGVEPKWHTYSCLYPEAPHYRLYFAADLSAAQQEALRRQTIALKLPKGVRRSYDAWVATEGWQRSVEIAQKFNVPVGGYAIGTYRLPGRPGAAPRRVKALVTNHHVPMAMMLQRLIAAAQHAR